MPRQPKYHTIASKIANAIIIYHPPEQNNNPKPQLASASTQPTSRSPPSSFFLHPEFFKLIAIQIQYMNLPQPPPHGSDPIITQFKPVEGQWELNCC